MLLANSAYFQSVNHFKGKSLGGGAAMQKHVGDYVSDAI